VEHHAEGARLLAFGPTLTLRHYTDLEVLELYDQDERSLRVLAAGTAPLYLLVDTANLESQWRDEPVAANFHWLREQPGLTTVDHLENYTLFRVLTLHP
jgi:hypothetical protein